MQYGFLQLSLPAGSPETESFCFRMNESLDGASACLQFKARGVDSVQDIAVSLNGRSILPQRMNLLPHSGGAFLYARCDLQPDEIVDGENRIDFALRRALRTAVLVQEILIRVNPEAGGSE